MSVVTLASVEVRHLSELESVHLAALSYFQKTVFPVHKLRNQSDQVDQVSRYLSSRRPLSRIRQRPPVSQKVTPTT